MVSVAQSRSAPVNGPILIQKAEEISKQLGHNEFRVSEGWFYRWKKRHDLSYIKLHGEASEANTKAAAEWTSCNMQELLKKYESANIYNADETALIFVLYRTRLTLRKLLVNRRVARKLQKIG